jgi:hypothetical protein
MSRWLWLLGLIVGVIMIGVWASVFGPIILFIIPVVAYVAKMRLSWQFHLLIALGLTIGVIPLWGFMALMAQERVASLVIALNIVAMPAMWVLGGLLQVMVSRLRKRTKQQTPLD